MSNSNFDWSKYPEIATQAYAEDWLKYQLLRLSINSVKAYANAVEDFFRFCHQQYVDPLYAKPTDVLSYIRNLSEQHLVKKLKPRRIPTTKGYALASQKQRLTAIRLFFDFLVEEKVRSANPVSRGKYVQGSFIQGERGLIPTVKHLPWIPTEDEWVTILSIARHYSIRFKFMLALGYDTGLRREELCRLEVRDIDPAYRTIHVRAETTKGKHARVVIYSVVTDQLFHAYLNHRRQISKDSGALFISESPRNYGKPITHEIWSKEIRKLRNQAGVPSFTPHTLRHLCLTDLARSGWDLHEIALFAGHRSLQSSLMYIHLSARDLIEKFKQGTSQPHLLRTKEMIYTLTNIV